MFPAPKKSRRRGDTGPYTIKQFREMASRENKDKSPEEINQIALRKYREQLDSFDKLTEPEKIYMQKILISKQEKEEEQANIAPIRRMKINPQTGEVEQVEEISAEEFKGRSWDGPSMSEMKKRYDQLTGLRRKLFPEEEEELNKLRSDMASVQRRMEGRKNKMKGFRERKEERRRQELGLRPGQKIPGEWHGGLSDRPKINMPKIGPSATWTPTFEGAPEPGEQSGGDRTRTIKRRTSRVNQLKKFDMLAARQEQRIAKKKV
jgi:hypothetical protein